MKNFASLLLMGLLGMMPATASVVASADLNASVAGYLLHGFLDEARTELQDLYAVEDALSREGVDLPYVVETNMKTSLAVYAVVTPFIQQNVESPSSIGISSFLVDGKELYPKTNRVMTRTDLASTKDSGPVSRRDFDTEATYEVAVLETVLGTTRYEYLIHVTANQKEVSTAPAGQYLSTVTMSLETRN